MAAADIPVNPRAFNEAEGYGRKYGSMGNMQTLIEKYSRLKHFEGNHIVLLPKLDGAHTSFEARVNADCEVVPGRPEDAALGLLVSPCKRTAFIGRADDSPDSEPFFAPGFTDMILRTQAGVRGLCVSVFRHYPDSAIIRVDGETVGGHYVHPALLPSQVPAINTSVQYCPDHRFVCYDIETVTGEGRSTWLPHMTVQALCQAHDVYVLEPVAEGPFEKVLGATYEIMREGGTVKFGEVSAATDWMCAVAAGPDGGERMGLSPIFRSTIGHELFGLPEIAAHDDEGRLVNPEEGWVIKKPSGGRRECVKFKHPSREEVVRVKRPAKAKTALTPLQQEGFRAAQDYLTEERLRHVLDRLSDADRQNEGRIKGMYMQDLLTEFCRDRPEHSGKKDKKAIQGELRALVGSRVAEWM